MVDVSDKRQVENMFYLVIVVICGTSPYHGLRNVQWQVMTVAIWKNL